MRVHAVLPSCVSMADITEIAEIYDIILQDEDVYGSEWFATVYRGRDEYRSDILFLNHLVQSAEWHFDDDEQTVDIDMPGGSWVRVE